ncbi:hypothetical protein EYF80_048410 [Liparis tanakae]|uniref:Uncharacterized protein n=1 Tax=Liparis tanakae TaxID=230148 RepID=A0A4Z2FKC5_9TELE|nr:hypothetical protein EYF80_048410 [Liparis tanakae]
MKHIKNADASQKSNYPPQPMNQMKELDRFSIFYHLHLSNLCVRYSVPAETARVCSECHRCARIRPNESYGEKRSDASRQHVIAHRLGSRFAIDAVDGNVEHVHEGTTRKVVYAIDSRPRVCCAFH